MRLGVRFVAAAAAGSLLFACADFSGLEDPAFGLPDVEVAQPSFVADVQPIFTKRCVVGGCHTLASEQAGLALDASVAYDELVGVPATSSVDPYLRVEAGNAADSWLMRRLHADPAVRNGQPRMPLAATPLTDNQIATIVNWIDQGALRN
jgi:hypothetical protein